MRLKTIALVALLALGGVFLTACGSDDNDETTAATTTAQPTTTEEATTTEKPAEPEIKTIVIRNGAPVAPWEQDGAFRLYGADGAFLALAEGKNGRLKTIKSFFEVDR